MKRILIALTFLFNLSTLAQDTASIMYYNILNFPSGDVTRADTMKTIFQYADPDLLLVNELESLFGSNLILNNALNVDGVTKYAAATFYNGTDTDNQLFYNSDKIGLIEQFQIATNLRDISEYHVYYKEPGMSSVSDTIDFWVYSCHLKAGSLPENEDQREIEAQQFKSYLDNAGRSGNLILGGDFNFYNGNDVACQEILNGGNIPLYDPINLIGNWNNNSIYANLHTQSTRSSSGNAGGSGGGMDDRFDIIFATDEVIQGSDRVTFVPGSYESFGQDGNHFNSNINGGTNAAVPANIADALFYNSDHLPVWMKLAFDEPLSIQRNEILIDNFRLLNEQQLIEVSLSSLNQSISAHLFNISGQLITEQDFKNTKTIQMELGNLPAGAYVLQLTTETSRSSLKLVIE
ncbi:MAG: hypothetical protein ACI8Q1_001494 [Parvicella sp.]|jgi:hypothetical protein